MTINYILLSSQQIDYLGVLGQVKSNNLDTLNELQFMTKIISYTCMHLDRNLCAIKLPIKA